MSDDDIKRMARQWLGPLRRGDCSVQYAVEQAVGEITYPYADSCRYTHVRRLVNSVLSKEQ